MYRFRIGFALTVFYLAYLFYVPIPDNVNQKFQYRSVLATTKFTTHLASLYSLVFPGTLGMIKVSRGMFELARTYLLPSGEIYAPDVLLKKESFDGVNVHVYTPPEGTNTTHPGFIYIHGGGLGLFDPEHYDGLTRKICLELNAVVLSIDYRLTPEHVFPVPLEDSLRATKWFLRHADEYDVDPRRVAIGGDSAGGYLSAAVAQAIHDDVATPDIKIQVLLYPWLQILDLDTPSYQKYRYDMGSEGVNPVEIMGLFSAMHIYGLQTDDAIVRAFVSNNHTSTDFKESSLCKERLSHSLIPAEHRDLSYYTAPGSKPSSQSDDGVGIWRESKELFLDPRLSPLLRKNLSGMPITYVVTVEYDSIRDDGIMYSKLLEQAGVDVTWRHYDNAFHGIIWIAPGIVFEDGSNIMSEMYDFVKSKL